MMPHDPANGPVATARAGGHPNSWLRELARVKKGRWEIGQTIRGALSVGLPWAVALALGLPLAAMWASYGAMRALVSETNGSYRTRLRTAAIAPLLGMVGFLAGGLNGLPWVVIVAVMAAFSFVAAVASTYSVYLSKAATHALLIAVIAIGLPGAAGWGSALLYFVGVVFYLVLLGIEALCMRGRTRHTAVTATLGALGNFAACRAGASSGNVFRQPEVEEARRAVTTAFTALGADVLQAASHHYHKDDAGARLALILAKSDAVFVALTAAQDKDRLQAAATALHAAADGASPSVASDDPLGAALDGLFDALDADTVPSKASGVPVRRKAPAPAGIRAVIDQIVPTRAVARAAAAVALCTGIAYAARWLVGIGEVWHISADHWYWIPLTVSMVMKPELGSVFTRAVLRIVGTVIGAAFGAVLVLLMPKGIWLALPIAVLSGLIPAATQRSYAILTAVMTPIILIFLSILDPVPVDTSYAVLRIENTVIGGGIVLIFGYFIWPRTHFDKISADFYRARQCIADYIRATMRGPDATGGQSLPVVRRRAYRELMDMRTHLRAALAEPPPASAEAAAWFPLIASAERICDHVTVYAAGATAPVSAADAAALDRLAADVAAPPDASPQEPAPACTGCSARVAALSDAIGRELQHMDRLRDDDAFQAASARAHPHARGQG